MSKFSTLTTLLFVLLFSLLGNNGFSQVNITPGSTITQDFNTIGTTAAAALPSGWRADAQSAARTLGTYAGAGTVTAQAGGANMSSSAASGIYNYGSTSNSNDRAVGGLSASSSNRTVNVYTDLLNTGAGAVSGLTISYNIEKYRFGTNAAGFTVQLYFSADGISWTSAGSNFSTSFAADATTAGNATTPITSVSVSSQTLTAAIASNAHLYLLWSYSVSSGTAGSNAQALGIDDVVINAVAAIPATPTTSSLSPASANAGGSGFTLTVNGSNFINGLSAVTWNGSARPTTFISTSQLTTSIAAADITATGAATVGVTTTGAAAVSNTQTFTINAAATPSFALSSGTAGFGNVCINTTPGPAILSFNGANLDGSNIFIAALPGYLFSETAGGTYTNTLSFSYSGNGFTNKQVYVSFTPTAVQSYDGSLTITGGGITPYSVSVSGAGINTTATVVTGAGSVSGSGLTFNGSISAAGCSSISSYGFEYSTVPGFSNGSGIQVLGSNLSAGNFSSTVTGLSANTTYYYKAFAVTGAGTSYGSQQSVTLGAVPVPMAAQPLLVYTEDFSSINSWSNGFASGAGASHFSAVPVNNTGTIPDGVKVTTNNVFASGTSGGVQKGSGSIVLLATGSPDNSTSTAFDLSLDFTGVNAGTLSFDWTSINNSTGDRNGSLRIYTSSNGGGSFTELPAAAVLNFTNNSPSSGSVTSVALPASFNNNANAKLRFYYYNGTGGASGSRPKIGISNLSVTAFSNTPCATPSAPATALVFGSVTDVSVQGSFTAASPAANEYLIVMSTNSSLTSNPVDGQVYNTGDNVGDGSVVARGPATGFTATGLSGSTTYYFFVFPINSVCLGGPKYLTANMLTDDINTAAGVPPCTAPASQPTGLNFSGITVNSIQGSFTAVAADEYLVLRSTTAGLSVNPVNGQVYNVNDALGNAIVVQRGNATSFTASGLTDNTNYYFYLFSIGSQACLNGPVYNTVNPLTASANTLPLPACATPAAQPTSLSFSASNNTISGTFNASASGDAYLVIRSNAAVLYATPSDNTNYNAGDVIGGGTVVTTTTAGSFSATNLGSATTYYFYVFAVNKNCTGGTKYLTASPLTGNATTTNAPANNYYFGNLHAHSDYSDGNKDHPGYTPTDDYNYALGSQGMDFLGISEHNHFSSPDNPGTYLSKYRSGILEAKAFTQAHPGFLALYGMEWGVISGGGHVVVYGDNMDKLFGWESNVGGTTGPNYDVFVPKSVYTGSTGLFKTINDYAANNTFATLAHPNNTDYNNLSNITYDQVADDAIVGSAVESGPATSTNTTYSNPASPMSYLWYFQKMLSRGYHLGPVIDHDNHNTTFGRTTKARTAVIAPALTQTDIIKAMRDMHFYATEDYDSKVDFTINTRMMGSVFSDRNAPAISVTLSDATTNTSNAIIRIMFGIPGSGVLPVKIDSVIGNTISIVDNNLPANTTGYYYADITNGSSRIITSPIWYTRTCFTSSDTTVTACGSYTWNGTTYTASGTATRNFTTAGGCDSVVTLHLTINQPSSGDTTAVACNSFTWYGTTYTNSGTATHVIPNMAGCDSTITLHLTINQSPASVSVTAAGVTEICPSGNVILNASASETISTYQWLKDGNIIANANTAAYTANASGSYSVRVTNANNCSVVSDGIAVTVVDAIAPVPDIAALPVINAACSVTVTAPTATDNCAGNITASTTDPVSFTQQGTYTIHWTYNDGNGNTSSQTQTVIIKDSITPVLILPASSSVANDAGKCGAVVSFAATATDNCSGPVIVTYSQDPGTLFPVGVTTVTVTATDAAGNSSAGSFTITVSDNEQPVIVAPAAIHVNTDAGKCGAAAAIGTATASDNCGIQTVSNDAPVFFPVGTTMVTWTATDIHGNTAVTTQQVTVTDNEAPVVNTRSLTVALVNGSAAITAASIDNGSSDNCGIATMTLSKTTFNCSNTGNNTVILTVTDIHGNTASATAVVTVTGQLPAAVITAIPSNNTYTGGVATNIYLGYGPQSVSLGVSASGGAPYTYAWSGNGTLSNPAASAPVFAPTAAGYYTFTVTVTNANGCVTSRSISICVRDIRVPGSNDKVYITHAPPGNPANAQTLSVSVNAVAAHLSNHPGDHLGVVNLQPCNGVATNAAGLGGVIRAEEDGELNVKVYPNPSAAGFKLEVLSSSDARIDIQVSDVNGRVVKTFTTASHTAVRFGSDLPAGTYFAEVKHGTRRKVVKLIRL